MKYLLNERSSGHRLCPKNLSRCSIGFDDIMRFHIEEECYSADEAYSFEVQTYAAFISDLALLQLPLV
jgi:hypothetical protein